MGIRDQDWVSRSVALSTECSESVAKESIKLLRTKRENSNIPHKIIAIACSVKHADEIVKIYNANGLRATVIHSNLEPNDKDEAFSDIENHRVDVVVNVAMLGEGYDHEYLSIAAIFRPFKSELPYVQFIGRVLRKIESDNPSDNIAQIISHHNLELDNLWLKYKKEINESKIIKSLKDYDSILSEDFDTNGEQTSSNISAVLLGRVIESNQYTLTKEEYLNTELIQKSKKDEEKMKQQITTIVETLGISEEEARAVILRTKKTPNLNRPDLFIKRQRGNIDDHIREEIVPELIVKYGIDVKGDDLKNSTLFSGKYWYVINKVKENDAMLAMSFNFRLKDKIGKPRKNWTSTDFDTAFDYLIEVKKYVQGILKSKRF